MMTLLLTLQVVLFSAVANAQEVGTMSSARGVAEIRRGGLGVPF